MRVESVELYRYAIPLLVRPPLQGARLRNGLLLRIVSGRDLSGWGEIAPLPGFSKETLSEAQALVLSEALNLVGREVPETYDDLSREVDARRNRISSVAFGIELGLASLSAGMRGLSLAEWMAPSARTSVPVNALLYGSEEEVVKMARARLNCGFKTFKLKVGRSTIDKDLETVRRVRDAIGSQSVLRLDANRAWEYDDARRFAEAILPFDTAFIEEPLRDWAQLKKLHDETSIPVALDETVSELAVSGGSPPTVEDFSFATAAILKPTLTGGLVETRRWADRFNAVGVEPVLSSSFESEIGLSGLVALAAAVSGSGWAAGLDTLRYLGGSVLEEHRGAESAILPADEIPGRPAVNMNALTRIL